MSEAFPFDYQALNKGDVIGQNKIEQVYQKKHAADPDGFRFSLMHLASEIETERSDLLTRIDGLSVRIMTDAEADDVTNGRIEKAVGTIARNARRRGVIDRNGFDDGQKKIAECRDGFATALMMSTRKELRRSRREQLLLGTGEPSGE